MFTSVTPRAPISSNRALISLSELKSMSWMSWCILAWGQAGLSKYNQWDTGQAWTAARSEAFVCESDPSYFRRIWPTHKSLLLDEVHASLVSHWFEIIPKRYRQDHWGQLISSQEINQTLHLPLPLYWVQPTATKGCARFVSFTKTKTVTIRLDNLQTELHIFFQRIHNTNDDTHF
jgi:hypothetical protein